MKKTLLLLGAAALMAGCAEKATQVQWTSTSEQTPWTENSELTAAKSAEATADIVIDVNKTAQTIDGFGTCFNELGWTSLSMLSEADRNGILSEMFEPGTGAGFTYCRMPVGANDFAVDWYSYNEHDGDFKMEKFSIDNDMKTLVPFIKAALKYNPDIKVWASPWSPPTWMKYNKHYALNWPWFDEKEYPQYSNHMTKDKLGVEGTDMFIQKPEYLEAYALYFSKFIDAYKAQGINIFAVAPQNEFNSCQAFPSCTWTARGLANFIGKYLGPAMAEKGVETFFGTMERPNWLLVDTVLQDPDCKKYVKAVTFQWAGKESIADVHKAYPDMKLIQSESECGDGKNEWSYAMYTWDQMQHYLNNGASAYEYWNTSLKEDGMSRWGWRQNSLVIVNEDTKTFSYTHEYQLMKHLSRYVRPGAKKLVVDGPGHDLLAFVNTDGKVAIIAVNKKIAAKIFSIKVGEKIFTATLPAGTINTFVL